MELMSSLLLCTLLAYVPQTLGSILVEDYPDFDTEIVFNTTESPKTPQHEDNMVQGATHLNFISDLDSVFKDVRCKECLFCMEQAIKAYQKQIENTYQATTSGMQKNLIGTEYEINNRPKRNSETETKVKVKRSKGKKKSNKSVTVTKYNLGGELYGLKVKERLIQGSEPNNNVTSTCHVYSIKKSYDCNTPESEIFLSAVRRNRKSKKEKERELQATTRNPAAPPTEKPHFAFVPSFKKRQVDQSEMAENFELSIEEIY